MNNKGYILIARKIQESDIWSRPPMWLKIWIHILLEVNHSDGQYPRGTGFFSYDYIKMHTGANRNHIESAIKHLKSTTQITTKKTTRGFIITVLKYNKFQDTLNYKSHAENHGENYKKATQNEKKATLYIKNDIKNERNIYIPKTTRSKKTVNSISKNNEEVKSNPVPDMAIEKSSPDFDENIELTDEQKDVIKINNQRIKSLLDLFYDKYKINLFNRQHERDAAEKCFLDFGYEQTIEMAKFIISQNGLQWAPEVFNPRQLHDKWHQIVNFQQRSKNTNAESIWDNPETNPNLIRLARWKAKNGIS